MVSNIDAGDRRVRFVGIKAYKKAGGHILRDLFQPEHDGYVADPEILDRLVIEKLERAAEALSAEGWKWVIIMPTIDREKLRGLSRVYPEREPPTEEQQSEIDTLTARHEALIEEHGEDPSDEIAAELEEISDKIDALSGDTERWLPEDIACAGCVIGIGYDGELAVERGLVRPEDRAVDTSGEIVATGRRAGQTNGVPALSDKLVEDLTAHRTAALRTLLAGNTDVALAAVVYALALPLFFHGGAESCLELSLNSAFLPSNADDIEASLAAVRFAERHEVWARQLPDTAEGLWDWLLARDTATRLDLLAHCAGCSVNAVRKRHERADSERLAHAERLSRALGLNMTHWWQATARSYFLHVPKARILETVRKAVTPEAADNLAKLKKDALAVEAEKRLSGTGWLPLILRAPGAASAEQEAIAAE